MYTPIYDRGYREEKTCLQKYISFTSYINLIISIIALAFVIYRAVKNSSAWSASSFDWNTLLIGIVIGSASLLFVVSIVGILGSRRRNKCCLLLFHLFSMILALAFLVIGFIFLGVTVYANDSSNFTCNENDSISQFYYAQQAYDLAQPLLCNTSCPCNVNNEDVLKSLLSTENKMLPTINPDGATSVQNCITYNDIFSNSNVTQEVSWLQFLEESFQCTGICNKPNNVNVFFFSNINSGVPVAETCQVKFQEFLQSYGKLVYLVALSVGFYLTFNAVLSFCLCCKRKESGLSLRERLAPY